MKYLTWKQLDPLEIHAVKGAIYLVSEEIHPFNINGFYIRNVDLYNPTKVEDRWFLGPNPSFSTDYIKHIFLASDDINELKEYAEKIYQRSVEGKIDYLKSSIERYKEALAKDEEMLSSILNKLI